MSKRPNILFLMSDEHRADVAGFAGNDVVRTPVLDELAASAMVFNNAYTPSPICIPARQCLASGQLPRTCGARQWAQDLPPQSVTWARVFSQHAYNAVCCGKLHHMGPDQMQGWRRRISFDDIHVATPFLTGMREEEAKRYHAPSQKWSDSKEVLRAGPGRSPHAVSDEFTVQAAESFIGEYFGSPYYDKARPHEPLLLKVSLLLPHYPYFCDEDKFGYYLNRVQPFVREELFDHPFLKQRAVGVGEEVTERDVQRATAAYYGMVETIDAQYGRVLAALRRAGQDPDDWIIVYTSDHGEMLGEHGIWEKQKFFEASVRVPLFIRWPRRLGQGHIAQNVNLCDLFATLCGLAGLPIPPGLDSRDLTPLMEGELSKWNDESISQFGLENLMIKRGALKYQYYGESMPEVLFDLARDPAERLNFLHEAAYAAELEVFRGRCAALGYGPHADAGRPNAGYNPA